jgi:hypothetical protein
MYVDTRLLAQCLKTTTFLHEVNTKMKASRQRKITNPKCLYLALCVCIILPAGRGQRV